MIVSRSPVSGEISYEDALSRKDVTFLVNTTPVGMYPHTDRQPIDLAEFPALEGVADVVYNPLRTRLLQQAEDLKLPCANGLLMLAAQAKYAAERFRDCRILEEKTLEVLRTLENDKCNVALTGMPMCGKSTLGRRLSELLHKKFVDVDEEIEKEASMTVPQIFERFGEAGFRELESRVVAALSQQNGLVISTGGGTVLAPGNIRNLRLNSILLFIDRPLSRLTVGKGRPLAKSPREIEALYQMRYPIYRANCHCRIENNSDPDTALSLAVKAYQDFLSGTFREFGSNR